MRVMQQDRNMRVMQQEQNMRAMHLYMRYTKTAAYCRKTKTCVIPKLQQHQNMRHLNSCNTTTRLPGLICTMNFAPTVRKSGSTSHQSNCQRLPLTLAFPVLLPRWWLVDFTQSWQQNKLTARNYILGGRLLRVASRRVKVDHPPRQPSLNN